MLYVWLAVGFVLPLITTSLLIPLVRRRALVHGWVDSPDGQRKLHAQPTPSVGGLAIAAGAAAGFAVLALARPFAPFEINLPHALVWAGAMVMVGVGFYDDTRGLSFKKKFVVQALLAFLLLHIGYRVDLSGLSFVDPDPYNQTLHSMIISMLWVVGIINAINLLDGLDGLAAGVVLIAFACMAFVYGMRGDVGLVLIGLFLIGALVGFLIYNFNPASIFMGDSGSLFLGFSLAAYTLAGEAHTDPTLAKLVPFVALGLPVMDTALSIVRRMTAGKSIFAPDHDHVHHRLTRRFSPRGAVLVLYGVATMFAVAAIVLTVVPPAGRLAVLGVIAGLAYLGIRSLGYLKLKPVDTVSAPTVHPETRSGGRLHVESGDGIAADDIMLKVTDRHIRQPVEATD